MVKRYRGGQWIVGVLIFIFIILPFIIFHLPTHIELYQFGEYVTMWDSSYFFIANLYNSEEILPHWTQEFLTLSNAIGKDRVFLVIYENNSRDNTKKLLSDFDNTLTTHGVKHVITTEMNSLRSVHPNRIDYLSVIRNQALKYMFEAIEAGSKEGDISDFQLAPFVRSLTRSKHSKVVFLNDIYYKAIDIVRLLGTHSFEYDIACGLDFYTTFYDHYATRDINGDWFAETFPYSREPITQRMARRGMEFPVYSCWNGAASMNVEPFAKHKIQFRSNEPEATCIHSECFLICEDFRRLNYTRIYVNPNVKVCNSC